MGWRVPDRVLDWAAGFTFFPRLSSASMPSLKRTPAATPLQPVTMTYSGASHFWGENIAAKLAALLGGQHASSGSIILRAFSFQCARPSLAPAVRCLKHSHRAAGI